MLSLDVRTRGWLIAGSLLLGWANAAFASFEQQGVGARAEGMGGAYAALCDTCDGIFYNPAGLSVLKWREMRGNYSRLYIGLDDDSAISNGDMSVGVPLGGPGSGIAAGYHVFSLQGFYAETVIGLYYGRRVDRHVAFGAGVKQLTISYGSDAYSPLNPVFANGTQKSGMSADVGLLVYPGSDDTITLAGVVRDANTPNMGLKYNDPVTRTMSISGLYRAKKLNAAAQIDLQNDMMKVIIAGERWFGDFGLRAGFSVGNRNYASFSTGMSVSWKAMLMDYSLSYPLSGLSDTYGTHHMTFGYRFDWKAEEQPAAKTTPKPEKDGEQAPAALDESPEAVQLRSVEGARYFDEALALVKAGKYGDAYERIMKAREIDPKNKKYELVSEKIGLVVEYIQESDGKRKTDLLARRGIEAYIVADEAKNAIELLTYAFSLDPGHEVSASLMKEFARLSKRDVPDLLRGVNYVEQKTLVAMERFKESKYFECVKLCEEALYLEPNDVTAYKRMGSAYYMLKNRARAKECWQKAVALAPDSKDAPRIRALIELMDKKATQIIKEDLAR